MTGERYVLLGLARPRAEWFRQVGQWATSAALPADFVKCVSAEELRARLSTGRAFSAALLDGGLPAVDRDLLHAIRDLGCVPLVVDDGRAAHDWVALGAAAVLPAQLGRQDLLDALATHGVLVGGGDVARSLDQGVPLSTAWQAGVAAVTGTGGSGTSTVAMALAQGLAADGRAGPVLLADFCRRAEQGMLHDARELFPGVQELVEAHRGGPVGSADVLDVTFHIPERGYHLLLGLRRPRYWSALRPRAFEAAFASLRATFGVVVCDIDDDLAGEADGGSIDVVERTLMSGGAAVRADVVCAVGAPTLKGLYGLAGLLLDLGALGVPAARIVPVLNQAPRQLRARAALASAFAQLTDGFGGGGSLPSPLFLPRRRVEESLRDAAALPAPLPALVTGAYHAVLRRSPADPAALSPAAPTPITPGTLGHCTDQADTA